MEHINCYLFLCHVALPWSERLFLSNRQYVSMALMPTYTTYLSTCISKLLGTRFYENSEKAIKIFL